jgi:hypothetical protein
MLLLQNLCLTFPQETIGLHGTGDKVATILEKYFSLRKYLAQLLFSSELSEKERKRKEKTHLT